MRYLFSIIILLFLASCKETRTEKKSFYPFTKTIDKNYNVFIKNFQDKAIFSQAENYLTKIDSLKLENLISFLTFKKDTIIWDTKNYLISKSFIDIIEYKNNFLLLSTKPKTLGKNLNSNDLIIKCDKNFNEIWSEELDFPKYPSAKSFIINNENNFIYISNYFTQGEKEGLILRKYSLDYEMLNEQREIATHEYFCFRPMFADKIDVNHFIVISNTSGYNSQNANFEISLFNIDFDKQWTKEINNISNLSHVILLKSKKIIVISEDNKDQIIHLYNFNGDYLKSITITNFEIDDVVSDLKDKFYIIGKEINGSPKILKLDNEASVIDEEIINETDFNEKQKFIVSNEGYFLCNFNSKNGVFRVVKVFENKKE